MEMKNVKKIVIDAKEVAKIEINGVVVWQGYTNLLPAATDTDGSIYNGTGYKDGVRLSSSGGVSSSTQAAGTTTGFIPFGGDTDIIRIKGVEWLNTYTLSGQHYYINFYDSNKKFLDYLSAGIYSGGTVDHIISITRDENGVETFDFNEDYGTTNTLLQHIRKSKYFRITAYGKGANMELTVNEEM